MADDQVPVGIQTVTLPSKLSAALVRAQRRVKGVGKSGKNEQHDYRYTTAEEMLYHAGAGLAEEGLAVIAFDRRVVGDWREISLKTRSGPRAMLCASTVTTIAVIHESGEAVLTTVELPAIAEGARPPDKAVLGTYTEAISYGVRDIALVARGELDISGRAEPAAPANDDPQQVALGELRALLANGGPPDDVFKGYLLVIHDTRISALSTWPPDDLRRLAADVRSDFGHRLDQVAAAAASLLGRSAAELVDEVRLEVCGGDPGVLTRSMQKYGAIVDATVAMILNFRARAARREGTAA